VISHFTLAGWGAYRPRKLLLSRELDVRHGHPPGWTEAQAGITSRHVAAEDETSSMMAAAAARDALQRAKWGTALPDVIIGGCGVMEQPIPSTSALVQDRLGLGRSGVPCFDVNQSCLSFMAALDIAALGMAAGRWRRALVFASDIASAGLDPDLPKTRSIFGDGAAAVAIEAGGEPDRGLLSSATVTYGAHHRLAQLRSGGTRLRVAAGYEALVAGSYFEMDAFGIFKAAAKALPGVIDRALRDAGIAMNDLACVICHQASAPGVEHVKRLFAARSGRVVDIFASTGIQIAASIPTVLAYGLETGRAKPGDLILLLGTAAGISRQRHGDPAVSRRQILITGATGGLGMALLREALARGHTVIATGRSPAAGEQAEALGATFVPLDLTNPQTDFRSLVPGCDSVIHAAALSASWGLRREFQAVNVTATARLLEAAADAGVSRFVFVSSPSIFADFRDRIGIGETAAPASQPLNHYAATKLAAERLVLAPRDGAMACCAIRPRALVGPGDRLILPRLAELAARKRMPLPRGGRALIELTDLRDAAWAICEAEQRAPDLAGRAINISGGKPVQVREVALEVARTLGRHPSPRVAAGRTGARRRAPVRAHCAAPPVGFRACSHPLHGRDPGLFPDVRP
jgi:3-oxoacyl-[acyl-carrier-protein] synthase-3